MLDEEWVDKLLDAEKDIRGFTGYCSLEYLLWSVNLDNFDYSCTRFKALLES